MRKLFLLLILFMALSVKAQDNPLVNWQIKPEQGDITKNIHFIIDRSMSMDPLQIMSSIDQVLEIAGQNTDEVNIAATMFGGNYIRWGGVEGSTIGWAAFPSADALEILKTFLEYGDKINVTSTCLLPPLINALNEEKDDLTIIIISDLIFLDNDLLNSKTSLASVIKSGTQRRTEKGLVTRIGFIGINATSTHLKDVVSAATECGAWVCNRSN